MKDQTVEGDSTFSRGGGDLGNKKGVGMGQGIRESGVKPRRALDQAPLQPPCWLRLDLAENGRKWSWAGRLYGLVKPSPGEREVSLKGEV